MQHLSEIYHRVSLSVELVFEAKRHRPRLMKSHGSCNSWSHPGSVRPEVGVLLHPSSSGCVTGMRHLHTIRFESSPAESSTVQQYDSTDGYTRCLIRMMLYSAVSCHDVVSSRKTCGLLYSPCDLSPNITTVMYTTSRCLPHGVQNSAGCVQHLSAFCRPVGHVVQAHD